MERKVLGIGIIGAGNIIRRHASAYKCLPQLAKLVAVVDIDLKRAQNAKSTFGFKAAFDNHAALLERDDIDVVSVCTPANYHAPIVIDAIQAGKHVLCEKPMANTLAEADDIIEAAGKRSDRNFSFVYQWRSEPAHARIRTAIAQQSMGRPLTAYVHVHAMRTPAYYAAVPGRGSWKTDGGGVLINQAIHQLDALISFLGEPTQASAVMHTFMQPTEAEDTLTGWVKFKSGAFATIECTVCAHRDDFTIGVLAENAAMRLTGGANSHACDWHIESRSSAAKRALNRTGRKQFPSFPEGPGLWAVRGQKVLCKLRGSEWRQPKHWGHTPFIQDYLETVQTGRSAPVPPTEARRSLELAVGLYQSALTGTIVTLPLDQSSPFYRGVESNKVQSPAKEIPALVS